MKMTSMIRNGYFPDGSGFYVKFVVCPARRRKGEVNNSYVERLVRTVGGKLVKVQTANKRRAKAGKNSY